MADVEKMVFVGAHVPETLVNAVKRLADANERSVAGEIRFALRAHVDTQQEKAA